MSDYDRCDNEVLNMPYKNQGPGGELPTIGSFNQPATQKPSSPVRSESVQPASTVEPNDMSRVKQCAINIAPISAMSAVVFWWQRSGQLAEPAGFYALIILGLIAGFYIGRVFKCN